MITPMNKYRIKARLRKGKIDLKKNVKNLFDWRKGAELIDLKDCDLKLKKETIHRQISSYPNQTP